jgi:hypothetical protein
MADPDRFEYAEFCGEIWGDVHNVRTLHWRVARALDALDPGRLRAAEYGRHITTTKKPHTKYAPVRLSDGAYLYNAWATTYLLEVVQAWISAFELDDALRVKILEPVEPQEPSTVL